MVKNLSVDERLELIKAVADGGENLRKQLKTRLKKFLEKKEKGKKSGKSTKVGIKKEDMQAAIIGFTNSGKSYLLNNLTNAHPKIAHTQFTTTKPIIGMMSHNGVSIQLIENPAFESEYYDKGLANTADSLLIVVENLEQIKEIEKNLTKAHGKKIIVLNKIDQLSGTEKRKISATLASKKYNFVLISNLTNEGYDELKDKIFGSFDKIRVFTKEPGKDASKRPIILEPETTIMGRLLFCQSFQIFYLLIHHNLL